ncbi:MULTISPECIES: sigma-70 family RNA polymerase sigma factor [unclassified Streptomyces]|uniref:sigma-70 family RNA polymerase sigma factor n=1 Tax=unclassified Streptomyces TaxID=2593676 RepID=UPI001F050349|nr:MULTISPECIES: sigma-70 family RNA polymerase sigma factor [unclassified Streptomyces]MCH0564606.1 XRE family transcriptional regulator [Streptomyces sp. MUM 2J]MCH0572037.1 XRE family transcriptional regulator [Streptomyces sp. MUM 136J]
MIWSPDADRPPPQDTFPAGGRRGRKPAPISDTAGLSHRAWLEPVRGFLFASGLTLDDLVDRSGYSKTRISELLRGNGYYPAWEITFSVIRALGLPCGPMLRLWTAAAREARKEPGWIEHCIQQVALQPEPPPLAHRAFTEAVTRAYTDYARAFLLTEGRARWVVAETFDVLWLCWRDAGSSENIRRYAWRLLRSRVMARAHRHHEGHPDLRATVFSTAEVHDGVPGHVVVLSELVDLFDAIGRLPQDQMDVAVLRYLCGMPLDSVPDVLGLSPAITHAVDHHARATLERLLRPHSPRE